MIYFIRIKDQPYVKIGFSKDVEKRLKQLQTSSPFDLEIIYTEFAAIEREKQLHEKYKEYQVKGEWFNISGDLEKFIKNGPIQPFYNFLVSHRIEDTFIGDLAVDIFRDASLNESSAQSEILKQITLSGGCSESIDAFFEASNIYESSNPFHKFVIRSLKKEYIDTVKKLGLFDDYINAENNYKIMRRYDGGRV